MTGYLKQPKAADEFGRQRELDEMNILDTPREAAFDRITSLVKSIFNVPVVAVTLVDRRRQWFKSIQGLDMSETPRDVAFCNHTIRQHRCLKVEDATQDSRFWDNPLVTGPPGIRAYLGAPLITDGGYMLGALCLIDFEPRQFSQEQEDLLSSFADVVMSELELRRVASVDELTRLSNRRVFNDSMKHAINSTGSPPASIILIDLDHFKVINDTFGHPAGDRVLQLVSSIIKDHEPTGSVPCRIGGEELAIILNAATAVSASQLAETLRKAISELRAPEIKYSPITASFGVAHYVSGQTTEAWFDAADTALYASKQNGRNQVTVAPSGK